MGAWMFSFANNGAPLTELLGAAVVDTLYPEAKDRRGDVFSNPEDKSPLKILPPPSNTKVEVDVDTNLRTYKIEEKTGDVENRPPSEMTFEEFAEYQRRKMIQQHWQTLEESNKPQAGLNDSLLFQIKAAGKPVATIRPAGTVTLEFGGDFQRTQNPAIPVDNQRTGGFLFDQSISLNLSGTIGERLKIGANWDTKAAFEFDNNINIDYVGKERDIIQDIEAGNVSMPLNNTLIRGAQNLFGLKMRMRFGHLYVTTLLSNQRGTTRTLTVRGGASTRPFEIPASGYDVYRHFFLTHYFRNQFNQAYRVNPLNPNNGFKITRVEIWITNRSTKTEGLRNIVGFTDLGEYNPNSKVITGQTGPVNPSDTSNNLLSILNANPNYLNADQTNSTLQNLGFNQSADYEKINSARQLEEGRDFIFHPDLGYISLVSKLQDDEALAVAFEYTFNGRQYKVGQLKEDYANVSEDEVIRLKLLKPQGINTSSPMWDLMMKNVYYLNTTNLQKDNFQLRIVYKDDRTGVDNPSLQDGKVKNIPLVQLLRADTLNPNGDFAPDANYDFIDGATVIARNGRVVLPLVEPFGSDLDSIFFTRDQDSAFFLSSKYTFQSLYDQTQSQAERNTEKNKFFLTGFYQSASSTDIQLPGINIAEGSVTITSGSITLREGSDFTVNYDIGRVSITNEGVLASGKDLIIKYEQANPFAFRTKMLLGTRLDYVVSDKINFGATLLHLNERPNITRIGIGDEPIKNTQYGLDATYEDESRFLTKMVDALPVIQTKAKSNVALRWEAAMLKPGTSKLLEEGGTSYIDAFEGARTSYSMISALPWVLGSTPRRLGSANTDYLDWLSDSLSYGYHRARLSWYNVDRSFYQGTQGGFTLDNTNQENPYTRAYASTQLFPNRPQVNASSNIQTLLDLAYYPAQRGPYNYNANPTDIDQNGRFINPENNWASITKEITFDTDFDNANVEFIQFWLLDPYLNEGQTLAEVLPEDEQPFYNPNQVGGELYINLGNVSEDILKDERLSFENGLPDNVDSTDWGLVPNIPFINDAFDNQQDRSSQDVGLDGVGAENEQNFFASYLNQLSTIVTNQAALDQAINDPSTDNFGFYRTSDGDERGLLTRYLNYYGYENNSPIPGATGSINQASPQTRANTEDINGDKTLNTLDAYFQYKVDLRPEMLNADNPLITNVNVIPETGERWLQFKIPVRTENSVGEISDFNTIKFMRMYMTNFSQPVVLRFAEFQLTASQWRVYTETDLDDPNPSKPVSKAPLTISTVSIEENKDGVEGSRAPYLLPPGVIRDTPPDPTAQGALLQDDEQSMELVVTDLPDKQAVGAFKNMAYDLINYGRIKMFVHAESIDPTTQDGDVTLFMRIGTDQAKNYYEIEVPLELTPLNAETHATSANPDDEGNRKIIWPDANTIDLAVDELINTKIERDRVGQTSESRFSRQFGKYTLSVVGTPDISTVRTTLIGLRNPSITTNPNPDDGNSKTIAVWVNELRATDFNTDVGVATTATLNAKLADFGTFSASGRFVSNNYGDIEQRISERTRATTAQYGASTNLDLDRLIFKKKVLSLPVYASYDREVVTPKFNPLNPDVKLDDALDLPQNQSSAQGGNDLEEKAVYKKTVKSINVTNVRKHKVKPDAKKHVYDIENLSVSAGYTEETRGGLGTATIAYGNNIKEYKRQQWTGGLAYNYDFSAKPVTPLKKVKFLRSKHLALVRDFNFQPLPNNITFRSDLNRTYTKTQLYNSELTTAGVLPTYEKSFLLNRTYGMRWNFTKSLSFNYAAQANAIVDEPTGDRLGDNSISRAEYKDSVVENLKNFGRLKVYNQDMNLNYRLPLSKIPLLNWVQADAAYKVNYNWQARALGLKGLDNEALGHIVSNKRGISGNAKLNMVRLYDKSGYLKKINHPRRSKDTTSIFTKAGEGILRLAMSVRDVNVRYSWDQGITAPGYLPVPDALGLNFGQANAPGIPFILGSQNLDQFQEDAQENGWYTRSISQNDPFMQSHREAINLRSTVEPFKSFRIQLSAKRDKSSNFSEIVRYDPNTDQWNSLSPVVGGSYSISFWSIPTAFQADGSDNISDAFQDFVNNRQVVQGRLQAQQVNGGEFDINSQSVLIPAFIAAYSGQSANSVSLKSVPTIPIPNWRVDYAGLSRLKPFKKYFSSFSIKHSYSSTYSLSQYTSSLTYNRDNLFGFDSDSDVDDQFNTLILNDSGQYVPVFVLNRSIIQEKFSPLIGISIRTKGKNKFNIRLNYDVSRELALDLANAQITDQRSKGFSGSLAFTPPKLRIPGVRGSNGQLREFENVTFKVDVSVRDTRTIQRSIDSQQTVTAGNLNTRINGNIDYKVNRRLNTQLFFERTINKPRISTSYPRSTTRFGIRLRFSLA